MRNSILFLFMGFVLGIGGMLLLNRPDAPPPASDKDYLEYTVELPDDVLSMTHGFTGSMQRFPASITSLENSDISNMMAITARVKDAGGKYVGVASELEIFPNDKGLRPGMTWKTWWTFTTPEGALFAHETEGPPLAHLPVLATLASGKDWTGSIPADTSNGPHASGRGIIVGGTGAYEGATGTFVEHIDLRGMSLDGEIVGTLVLKFYFDNNEGME